jgi:hypothetical protein
MHAGGINQHNLRAWPPFLLGNMNDALNTVAGGLRLGRNDG